MGRRWDGEDYAYHWEYAGAVIEVPDDVGETLLRHGSNYDGYYRPDLAPVVETGEIYVGPGEANDLLGALSVSTR